MKKRQPDSPGNTVISVVLKLLETRGCDAVHLREVARRARVSLATIYEQFPTRDELIVTAMERWMVVNAYAELTPPAPDESLYDGLMRQFRYVFEPWERSPRMLEAYHRARSLSGGERLTLQSMNAIEPIVDAVLEGVDPDYQADITLILENMAYAVIGRFADGDIDISDILPTLERAVYRLTANNELSAKAARSRPRNVRARTDKSRA